jgi:hypothetical protein
MRIREGERGAAFYERQDVRATPVGRQRRIDAVRDLRVQGNPLLRPNLDLIKTVFFSGS